MSRGSVAEIERIASEWLARRDSGKWSADDAARLGQWLSASAANRVAFLRLEYAWEKAGRLKALAAGICSEAPPPPGQWNLSPFFDGGSSESTSCLPEITPSLSEASSARRTPKRWAVAACLFLAVVIAGTSEWHGTPGGRAYSAPVGGSVSIPMRDGSKVTLNTNTRIRVKMTNAERRVDLTRGEAFFEVAKDSRRPFVVEAGKKRVVAVGTKFAVRREGENIEVMVTEGKVRFEDASVPLRIGALEPQGAAVSARVDGTVFLTPGAVARAGDGGLLVQRKTLPEMEIELSWRSGIISFRDETLAAAVAEFNRYTERKIAISDPAVAGLKIEGNFRVNNVSAFLELLQGGYPVKVTEEPDQFVVTAK